jgi:hypothetical protein
MDLKMTLVAHFVEYLCTLCDYIYLLYLSYYNSMMHHYRVLSRYCGSDFPLKFQLMCSK